MFKKNFQGGSCVTIFAPLNKDLVSKWFIPKGARKEFDKIAKTYVYSIKNMSVSQNLFIPKDWKMSLGLTQPYLVLQVYLISSQMFSLEVRTSCKSGDRKRILFSSIQNNIKHSILSSVVPLHMPVNESWLHLCIYFPDIVSELWNEEYKSVDSVSIGGNCKLRQVYTMNSDMVESKNGHWQERYLHRIPKQCHFPMNVPQMFFMINKNYLRERNESLRNSTINQSSSLSSVQSDSGSCTSRRQSASASSFADSVESQFSSKTFIKNLPAFRGQCSSSKCSGIINPCLKTPNVSATLVSKKKAPALSTTENSCKNRSKEYHSPNSKSTSSHVPDSNFLNDRELSLQKKSSHFPTFPLSMARNLMKNSGHVSGGDDDSNSSDECQKMHSKLSEYSKEERFNMKNWEEILSLSEEEQHLSGDHVDSDEEYPLPSLNLHVHRK